MNDRPLNPAQLSHEEKRQLLTALLRQKASRSFPLSFAQQRLWFLDQWAPGSTAYHIPFTIRLTGALNPAVLHRVLNEIVHRHEALRTTFSTVEGQAVQVIAPSLTIALPLVDLCQCSPAQQDGEVARLAIAEAQQPFDLSKDALLRVVLLRLDAAEHILFLTLHHIIADGWSMKVLFQELTMLYAAFAAGKPSPLPELPIQYADFAVWQRQWLQGDVLDTQLAYWRQQLQGTLPVLQLPNLKEPSHHGRSPLPSTHSATHYFHLSNDLTNALKALSQQENATLFMTLLAAFKTLLYRYTGQTDLLVGSPIANRQRSELEGLIGFFVNTLVLRTDLAANPTFRELLGRVRQVTLGAYTHQDLPFERLVDELQPDRDQSHNPLFQVMFVLHNAPVTAAALPGLTFDVQESDRGTTNFDLALAFSETKQGLLGQLEYSTALFDDSAMTRFVEQFQTLLAGVIAHPDAHLSALPLLTPTEQKQLAAWSVTQVQPFSDRCLHHLFEAQVERTPDGIAVVFHDEHISYHELNLRANQLAHYLRSLGVKPEALVGVCLDRSINLIISLLAILKAGGAYVPLDPAYPKERLAQILMDAQVSVLLTAQPLLDRLPTPQTQVVCLDQAGSLMAQQRHNNPDSGVKAGNLAYLIYTSGSTGVPKGVMIQHHSLVNYMQAAGVAFGLGVGDRVLQFASISFDLAAEEIFSCLLCGATLVLRTDAMLSSTPIFLRQSEALALTVLDLPTAFWHQIAADMVADSLALPKAVRLVIIGGEAAFPERLANWQQQVEPDVRLINSYGPTETTIVSTIDQLSGDGIVPEVREPSIGRPICNLEAYVLDAHLQQVPMGVPGELYIGGVGVARGYRDRPDLTAARFLPHPYSAAPGARLYRTGDLVRYRSDGRLDYLGRIDQQVKVRGFRIELGEIEAVLRQHPTVQDAIVTARRDGLESQRLVAYVVPNPSNGLNADLQEVSRTLRAFLQSKLPAYTVPAAFVVLEALPLTPNGKVDRQSLPAPHLSALTPDRSFVAPRTVIEAKLAQIWAAVLQLERVGIHDNFFELGGDSILSIQIIAKANQAGLQVTPKDLFQHQTIAALASDVTQDTGVIHQHSAAAAEVVTGTVPLTPIQHWFFEQALPEPSHFNQAVMLEAAANLNPIWLASAIQHILRHHDALRLEFEQTDVTTLDWQQTIAPPTATVPLIQVDLSAIATTDQGAIITRAATQLQTSLDLTQSPLLRVALFHCGQQPDRVLIVVHHLAVDGVSWRILLEDLQTAYHQIAEGKPVQLPAKTTSFKQWAEQLQTYARSAAVQQELRDWLIDRKPAPLPVDLPTGTNTLASAQTVTVQLSPVETQALLQDVPKTYHTQINDVLLTALVGAFAPWTGARSLLVDLEGHGREDLFEAVNLSRTVGWFTTVFPVWLEIESATDPGVALKQIKEQLRRIPNRGIGYGVWRYLSDDRSVQAQLRSRPPAAVIFNYLGQFDQTFAESSLFKLARESTGPVRSPNSQRSHLLEINGAIVEGQLRLHWTYSQTIHHRSTIETLAHRCLDALRDLIAHCQSPHAGGFTPSDFPLMQLSQTALDQALSKVKF